MSSIILQDKREQAILRYHPWIFSGAIKKVLGTPEPGETVTVLDKNKTPLAVGAYSPHSQIRVRIWDFAPTTVINQDFFKLRLQATLAKRKKWLAPNITAFRWVNSETDGLPGIIIDVYDNYVVLQCLSAGAYYWRAALVAVIPEVLPSCQGILERNEGNSLAKEGLTPQTGWVGGNVSPTMPVSIQEYNLKFYVDILHGHKTGFYLDQRDNRLLVSQISAHQRVLNCFAYTGGFGIAALAGGAHHVTHVEASAKHAEYIHANVELNNFNPAKNTVIVGDVFEQLRIFQERKEKFDLIILDPPKFADAKHQLVTACRGYKDINRLAMELLTPGGNLLTFSCSGAIYPDLFNKVVADAAIDVKRQVLIRQRLWQACDHTTTICFPEGLYLKGLWCEV